LLVIALPSSQLPPERIVTAQLAVLLHARVVQASLVHVSRVPLHAPAAHASPAWRW
jgi:hypothetical protein